MMGGSMSSRCASLTPDASVPPDQGGGGTSRRAASHTPDQGGGGTARRGASNTPDQMTAARRGNKSKTPEQAKLSIQVCANLDSLILVQHYISVAYCSMPRICYRFSNMVELHSSNKTKSEEI